MEAIRQSVSAHGNQEDIILAHTCPYNFRPVECFLSGVDESGVDNSMERFLQEIVDMTDWNEFYCGHWHIDKQVAADPGGKRKLRFLFHDILMLMDCYYSAISHKKRIACPKWSPEGSDFRAILIKGHSRREHQIKDLGRSACDLPTAQLLFRRVRSSRPKR